jgi:spoIIIJ-associated protein
MAMNQEQQDRSVSVMAEMLGTLGFEAEVVPREEDGKLILSLQCEKPGRLIGRKGVYIDSFELLLNRVLRKSYEKCDWVALEIDGYQKRQRGGRGERRSNVDTEMLEGVANDAAKEVKRWGEEKEIGPFNAAERRVIHMTLREVDGIETESLDADGEGKKRIIVRAV